jgi:hypothetical protein
MKNYIKLDLKIFNLYDINFYIKYIYAHKFIEATKHNFIQSLCDVVNSNFAELELIKLFNSL